MLYLSTTGILEPCTVLKFGPKPGPARDDQTGPGSETGLFMSMHNKAIKSFSIAFG